MVRAENPSCARIRSNDKKYKKEEEEMTEHEYTDTYYYKKVEKERQSKQKQDGMKKSLYRIVSVLVAVIGSICFLLAALLLNCNMKCEKINELSFHTSFFYEKNQ